MQMARMRRVCEYGDDEPQAARPAPAPTATPFDITATIQQRQFEQEHAITNQLQSQLHHH